jgi:CO dehydrogenase maturation factor
MLILVAGKGGVGKTTLMGTLVRWLQSQGRDFAVVDADPVGGLARLLDAPERPTIVEAFDEPAAEDVLHPDQLTWAEHVQRLLAPLPGGGALLRMGHHRHEGCFCRINALTRTALQLLAMQFPLMLLDNEAGLEHLTRGLGRGRQATRLILVSDWSRAGLQVAGEALETVRALNSEGVALQGSVHLVIRGPDQSREAISQGFAELRRQVQGLELPAPRFLPYDGRIVAVQFKGEPLPLWAPTDSNPLFYRAVAELVKTDHIV